MKNLFIGLLVVMILFCGCTQRESNSVISDALFPVTDKGKCGYIDGKGNIVIKATYDGGEKFSEGLAAINVGGEIDHLGITQGGKWGYVGKTGKIVIEPTYTGARRFTEGLAGVRLEGKWGYIDSEGEMVIEPQFDWAGDFSD